jgi:7-cyano-7-deazaguanine synthase in queuosine biosynthesis
MNLNNVRICQTCVMNDSDPNIIFYEDGTCSHCRHAIRYASHSSSQRYPLDQIVALVRQISGSTPNSKYDCIVGLSGGVDSSWLLHLLVPTGLKIYVHHVDTGWNTAKAVANVYRICDALGQDLHTHVVDWTLFRKIQQAYFYLGVLNQDVPQDIAIFSSQIMACKNNSIPCLVSGANNTTESILPSAWSHHWHDLANLKSIYANFWKEELSQFPYTSYEDLAAYRLSHSQVCNLHTLNLLDLVNYKKSDALLTLKDRYSYEEYPHKHGESSWTLYYQAIYLPDVYHIDKRRAHLSNLIINEDISRVSALTRLEEPTLSPETKADLANFVSLKLGIPLEHALNPGRYVLPVRHSLFTSSKTVIDQYTSKYISAPPAQREDVFNEYMRAYRACYSGNH